MSTSRRASVAIVLAALGMVVAAVLSGCARRDVSLAESPKPRVFRVLEADTVTTYHLRSLFEDPRFQTDRDRAGMTLTRQRGHVTALGQIREAESLHHHRRHDLMVVLLEGRGRLHTAGDTVEVRPGDVLVIPRGVAHRFLPIGDRPARALIVRTPPPGDRDFHTGIPAESD